MGWEGVTQLDSCFRKIIWAAEQGMSWWKKVSCWKGIGWSLHPPWWVMGKGMCRWEAPAPPLTNQEWCYRKSFCVDPCMCLPLGHLMGMSHWTWSNRPLVAPCGQLCPIQETDTKVPRGPKASDSSLPSPPPLSPPSRLFLFFLLLLLSPSFSLCLLLSLSLSSHPFLQQILLVQHLQHYHTPPFLTTSSVLTLSQGPIISCPNYSVSPLLCSLFLLFSPLMDSPNGSQNDPFKMQIWPMTPHQTHSRKSSSRPTGLPISAVLQSRWPPRYASDSACVPQGLCTCCFPSGVALPAGRCTIHTLSSVTSLQMSPPLHKKLSCSKTTPFISLCLLWMSHLSLCPSLLCFLAYSLFPGLHETPWAQSLGLLHSGFILGCWQCLASLAIGQHHYIWPRKTEHGPVWWSETLLVDSSLLFHSGPKEKLLIHDNNNGAVHLTKGRKAAWSVWSLACLGNGYHLPVSRRETSPIRYSLGESNFITVVCVKREHVYLIAHCIYISLQLSWLLRNPIWTVSSLRGSPEAPTWPWRQEWWMEGQERS